MTRQVSCESKNERAGYARESVARAARGGVGLLPFALTVGLLGSAPATAGELPGKRRGSPLSRR